MASVKISGAAEFAAAIDKACGTVHENVLAPVLYEESLRRGESQLVAGGPVVADTGIHTGRSPKDKFIVRDAKTDPTVWWGGNQEMSPAHFDALLEDFIAHIKGGELFAQDLFGGAHPDHQIGVRVYTELAWHSLFIRNLLIRPIDGETVDKPEMIVIDLPSFKADKERHGARTETIIACDFSRGIVLIGGSSYAGEMKKSVFTYLNYILPDAGVMPMHCSANVGDDGRSAIFFGLSGTGKTTLSADSSRTLVGDDEHGWGPGGIFNFEGGCYAKTINLSREAEPEIYATTERFGTVLENVVIDPATRAPDFEDDSKTENTRAAYPLDFIANASPTGLAGHPANVIMLTCDAFGVMPPIARLNPAQALYHFLSGYTAKVAGTEKGVTEPEATFSTCFGHPFIPRPPVQYGELLRRYINEQGSDCWLINTGWTGGSYGVGRRMPIKVTRTLLAAVLDGRLRNAHFYTDQHFGFQVPTDLPGVEPHLLHPRKTWADKTAFDETATKLVAMFMQNFAQFEPFVDPEIKEAAPRPDSAAA